MLTAGNNSGTYGEFAEAAAKVTLAEEPKIKKYGDWWLLGKDVARMDVAPRSTAAPSTRSTYALPGMVYAAVKASPVPGGKLKSYNFDAIKGRPGVIAAVELKQYQASSPTPICGCGIAVVADSSGTAPRPRST